MHPLISLLHATATDQRDLSVTMFSDAHLEWALKVGLGPLLHHATSRQITVPGATPDEEKLIAADLTARILIGNLLDATDEILHAAPDLTANVTLLKGIVLCGRYPEPHLRTMGDIDLFVSREVQPSLESLLLDLGYRQQSTVPPVFYETHHHSMPFFNAEKHVWVEVHTGLFPLQSPLANERVFSNTHLASQLVPLSFRGAQTTQFSNELHILYTCSHWANDLNRERGLIPMLDVLYLLRDPRQPIDWDSVLRWSSGSLAASHLYLMLTYLARYGLTTTPAEVTKKLAATQKSLSRMSIALLHRLIDTYLLNGKSFSRLTSASTFTTVWRTLLSPGSARRNLASIPWRLAFPPNEPRRFRPLFQLRRMVSLFGLKR